MNERRSVGVGAVVLGLAFLAGQIFQPESRRVPNPISPAPISREFLRPKIEVERFSGLSWLRENLKRELNDQNDWEFWTLLDTGSLAEIHPPLVSPFIPLDRLAHQRNRFIDYVNSADNTDCIISSYGYIDIPRLTAPEETIFIATAFESCLSLPGNASVPGFTESFRLNVSNNGLFKERYLSQAYLDIDNMLSLSEKIFRNPLTTWTVIETIGHLGEQMIIFQNSNEENNKLTTRSLFANGEVLVSIHHKISH